MDDTNTNPIPPINPVPPTSPTPPVPPASPVSPTPTPTPNPVTPTPGTSSTATPVAPTSDPTPAQTPTTPSVSPTPTTPTPSQPTPPTAANKIGSTLFHLSKIAKIIAAIFVISIFVIIIAIIIIVNVNKPAEETNTANPSDSSTFQSADDNPTESLDTETTISDFITLEIPEGFIESSETNDSQLSYYYPEDDDSVRGSCSFTLNMPTGFDDANAVLETAINELYPGNEGEDTLPQIKSTKLKGHTWLWFSNSTIDSDNYYYATDFADHIFFIEFDSGLLAPSECHTFRSTILNSLEPVEQSLIR